MWLGQCWARDVVRRQRQSERRWVVSTPLREVLEPRRQLDQRRLAECGPKEADAHRRSEDANSWDLDDRVATGRRDARRAEDEVVAEDEVGRPCGVVGGGDESTEVLAAQRPVDVLLSPGLVGRQRLVVGLPAKGRLRVVRTRRHAVAEIEDVLVEERHLLPCVRVVEIDERLQRPTRARYSAAGGEVALDVIFEVEAEDFELAWTA